MENKKENAGGTVCVFPGTFDPFTSGHLDLLKRASKLFGRVTVAVAEDCGKTGVPSAGVRADLIVKCIKGVKNASVKTFGGLLADFCAAEGAVCIARGVRNSADLEYENSMAYANGILAPAVETIYFSALSGQARVSSSLVRDLAALGADIGRFVPPEIADDVKRIYGSSGGKPRER